MRFEDLRTDDRFEQDQGLLRCKEEGYRPLEQFHTYAIVNGKRFSVVRIRIEKGQLRINNWHEDHAFPPDQEFELDMWKSNIHGGVVIACGEKPRV